MANLGKEIKTVLFKGLESIGDAAANLGTNAKQKLNEMKLENRRDELRRALPSVLMKLWQDGAQLPEELSTLLAEISDLDEQLAAMRAKPEPAADEASAQDEADAQPGTLDEALDVLEDKVEEAKEAVEDFVVSKAEQIKESLGLDDEGNN